MSEGNRQKLVQTQKLRLTQNLTTAMRLLRFDASGLTRYLEEQAAENPVLRLDPPPVVPGEWLPRWSGVLPGRAPGGADAVEMAASAGPSLIAHVSDAIARMFGSSRARGQAMIFAQALEPSGWLGRPLRDIAADAGLTPAEAETMLGRLQDIEPVGIFARNLRECLELQAREAGWLDPPMAVILANLDRVAAGDVSALARRAGVDSDQIALRLRRLRGLNPKPGTQFEAGSAPVREPDLILRRGAQGWEVSLNRGALPAVSIDAGRAAGADPAARAAARALCRQVEARGTALLRIAAEVLRRQETALDHGPTALRPLGMAEVAEALRLHPSTISRAVAGVSLDGPRGTIWLRALFSVGLGEGEGAQSGAALRARLAELVAAEDVGAPLSDAALADRLAVPGQPPPARRTVAKYRAVLGLPPAHRRRRGPR